MKVGAREKELESQGVEYHAAHKLVAEKERVLEDLVKAIKERSKKLDSLERSIRQRYEEFEGKGNEFDSIRFEEC
ncbi:hypothetical protein PanWU01x14_055190 [Parasponia andersonii]|uniref:Uncharacterized protein n=1 Tax=Parasponia andersonii TaxID=3476 RepID=A0A2P5DKZ3_PARAD|nr:hypothetical protein PanWU01x14_055190 [Parasponia andersonii]